MGRGRFQRSLSRDIFEQDDDSGYDYDQHERDFGFQFRQKPVKAKPMHRDQSPATTKSTPACPNRRAFLRKAAALGLGALAMLAPIVSGVLAILDPLRRQPVQNAFVYVTSLQSVPEDGLPRKFAVVAGHSDAWNKTPAARVGAVYLRRTENGTVQAFNVVCPHAGCFVEFVRARRDYVCPCHHSVFALNGGIADPNSPAPRGLDELEVRIRNQTEVWVKFQNFLAGHKARIPVA
jgi:quinol---cytochrome c reductase iron-sulfur subunit, bacillus type